MTRRNILSTKSFISLIMVLIITLAACKSEEERWQETQHTNTPTAYIDFITSYPNSAHADKIYSFLKDTIKQMHLKAWEIRTSEEFEWSEVENVLNRILEINPNDALALHNLATVVIGTYYDNEDENKLREGMMLFNLAAENSNRQRISTSTVGQVIEGQLIKFAQPPQDSYKLFPLRDLAVDQSINVQKILDLPIKRPEVPKDLFISGTLVDLSNNPVYGITIWAVEVGGDIENNKLETKYQFNNSGELTNPSTKTNENGQFSFNISYANTIFNVLPKKIFFLTTLSDRSIMNGNSFYLSKDSIPVIVDIDDNTYNIPIGKCQVEVKY